MMQFLKKLGALETVDVSQIILDEEFMVFARRFAHLPGTVLLASGGELDCARYHLLGIRPWMTYSGRYRDLVLATDGERQTLEGDPFEVLNNLLKAFSVERNLSEIPVSAGLMGYLAYDLKDVIENLPRTSVDDLMLPHFYLVAPAVMFIQDVRTGRTWRALACLEGRNVSGLLNWLDCEMGKVAPKKQEFGGDARGFKSNFSKPRYEAAIRRIKEYIAAGDVYQVNMSQRFQMDFHGDAFGLFEKLFEMNPAPFFAYVNAGGHQIISTSPERFLRQNGRHVETRPIKGTRPRGVCESDDARQAADLVDSRKDDAELSMIVDLLRNDLGKVCEAGSVQVVEHKRLEAYRNVWHLVSIVTGILDTDKTSSDLVRAAFPGGSITGCPKIRSMEIIDELEPHRRHIYTGAIGYIGFHDTMDLNIAIRTATVINGKILFSVGGGIVHDSDPENEYEETLHKGQTLMTVFKGAKTRKTPQTVVWMNGVFTSIADASLPAFIPGVAYGDGFFETFRANNGHCPHLFDHLDRFCRTWEQLWKIPPPDVTWKAVVHELLHRNRLDDKIAAVKIMAIKGDRNIPPMDTILAIRADAYRHRLEGLPAAGIRLITYPWPRTTPLADHKTLNYLYYRRAGKWAIAQGADEALILNPDGTVSETNTANMILFTQDEVVVPESPHALPGVTQRMACRFLESNGASLRRMPVDAASLHEYDAILLTNALMGAVPVVALDGSPFPKRTNLWMQVDRALWSGAFSSI